MKNDDRVRGMAERLNLHLRSRPFVEDADDSAAGGGEYLHGLPRDAALRLKIMLHAAAILNIVAVVVPDAGAELGDPSDLLEFDIPVADYKDGVCCSFFRRRR